MPIFPYVYLQYDTVNEQRLVHIDRMRGEIIWEKTGRKLRHGHWYKYLWWDNEKALWENANGNQWRGKIILMNVKIEAKQFLFSPPHFPLFQLSPTTCPLHPPPPPSLQLGNEHQVVENSWTVGIHIYMRYCYICVVYLWSSERLHLFKKTVLQIGCMQNSRTYHAQRTNVEAEKFHSS